MITIIINLKNYMLVTIGSDAQNTISGTFRYRKEKNQYMYTSS